MYIFEPTEGPSCYSIDKRFTARSGSGSKIPFNFPKGIKKTNQENNIKIVENMDPFYSFLNTVIYYSVRLTLSSLRETKGKLLQ